MREISSRLTLTYKYVGCWFAIIVAIISAGIALYMSFRTQTEVYAVWMCILISGVFVLIFYIQYRRLVKVELSEKSILVSNRRQKIEIPLTEIAKVSGFGNLVEITLQKPNVFGRHIAFFHNSYYYGLVPPIVSELKEKIEKAKLSAQRNGS